MKEFIQTLTTALKQAQGTVGQLLGAKAPPPPHTKGPTEAPVFKLLRATVVPPHRLKNPVLAHLAPLQAGLQ